MIGFSYEEAFDRNIGLVSEWEQQALRGKRVAVAGAGGVGGYHITTLARFGVGAFNIADFDQFDIANFNRQIGANVNTVGRPKAEVLAEMALAINPELEIRRFDEGINQSNIDEFLDGVDVFIDGFDFFVLDIRQKVYDRCSKLGIPALCGAPIGMGVGFLAFLPGKMSFEEYFCLRGRSETEQYLRFLIGLVPRRFHSSYLIDPTRVDLAGKRGPSTVAACLLCSGVAAVAAVKLMLRRGGVLPAPYHHHYDPYVGRLAISRLRWGNAGPLQRLKLWLGKRQIGKLLGRPHPPALDNPVRSPLQEILHAARWAPSGDNTQPWRFQILNDREVRLFLGESRDNVYEYRGGEPTLLAGGALLESLRIAASAWGHSMQWRYECHDGARHLLLITFELDTTVSRDLLFSELSMRSVIRRPFRTRKLRPEEKDALTASVEGELAVEWRESLEQRWRIAGLNARATDIRLRAPEAYNVHRSVIDWERDLSPNGIPAGAVGLNRISRAVMHWGMRNWRRLQFINRLGGPRSSAIELDYIPALASAGFFALRLSNDKGTDQTDPTDLLRAGQCLQRFWLTATRLGLALQPTVATLIFAHYGATKTPFTQTASLQEKAEVLAIRLQKEFGGTVGKIVFLGRIGEPIRRLETCRSVRKTLTELAVDGVCSAYSNCP